MKCFLLLSLFVPAVLNTFVSQIANPGGPLIPASSTCPNRNTCGRPAPLANLICYENQQANGFNYAFIGFNDNIVALCSINLNCQPGVVSVLKVMVVYGFMFKLTYPVWYNNKITGQRSKIWYLNIAIPGCPSIEEVENYEYNNQNGQFNPSFYPTPIGKNVGYDVYQEMIERDDVYKIQCNVFRSAKVNDDCNCCPSQASSTAPIAALSLGEIKTALMYNGNPHSKNGSAFQYIHDYGIYGIECPASKIPVRGIKPPLYRETCFSYGYDSSVYCRNFQNSPPLSEIARSYNFDVNLEYLDVYEACKLATLWAQGYNCEGGNNDRYSSCPRNEAGSGSFTYVNMAIIPMATSFINFKTPLYPEAFLLMIILKGYCPTSFEDAIMQNFIGAC